MIPGAVIYIRVSTSEQTKNLSLPTQLKSCREYCQREKLREVRVFEDAGESAKTTERPAFLEMLAYCKANKDRVRFVVVYNITRFSRSTHDHLVVRALLNRSGVSLRSASERIDDSPVGRLTESMLSAIGQFDNDSKAERTIAGMRAALERGRWPWRPPLGYLVGNANIGEPCLIPDPQRAPLIRQGFEMLARRDRRPPEVLRAITALGLRTKAGLPLSAQTFGALIQNPIFTGILNAPKFDMSGIRGNFEPIVTESTFRLAQKELKGRTGSLDYLINNPIFPLRRFVACAKCASPLTASTSRGRTKGYPYYHCKRCKRVRSPKERLEQRFSELLRSIQIRPEVVRLFRAVVVDVWNGRRTESQKIRASMEARLRDVTEREERLDQAFLYERSIDRDTYHRQRDKLREQSATTQVELAECGSEQIDLDDLLSFAEGALSQTEGLWRNADSEHKPRLQAALFPQGLTFDGIEFRTVVTCSAFSVLQGFSDSKMSFLRDR